MESTPWIKENKLTEFSCLKCGGLATEPVLFPNCEHLFCKSCIKYSKSATKYQGYVSCLTKNCLSMISIYDHIEIPESKFVKKCLYEHKVNCPNSELGCTFISEFKDMINGQHFSTCSFSILECHICYTKTSRQEFDSHIKRCLKEFPCILCDTYVCNVEEAKAHVYRLPWNKVLCPGVQRCPNGCQVKKILTDGKKVQIIEGFISVDPDKYTTHLEIECDNLVLPCPYCKDIVSKVNYKQHVLNGKNKNVQKHLQGLWDDLFKHEQ